MRKGVTKVKEVKEVMEYLNVYVCTEAHQLEQSTTDNPVMV